MVGVKRLYPSSALSVKRDKILCGKYQMSTSLSEMMASPLLAFPKMKGKE